MTTRPIPGYLSYLAAAGILSLVLAAPILAAEMPVADRFRAAHLPISRLHVEAVGGILIIRGNATDAAAIESANQVASTLGYNRVANLVRIIDPPDDAVLQRTAERELGETRSLDGCNISVVSKRGVLRLDGTVRYELQKDVATEVLRNIDGVRGVEASLRLN